MACRDLRAAGTLGEAPVRRAIAAVSAATAASTEAGDMSADSARLGAGRREPRLPQAAIHAVV
eukprot:3930072-Lingulodinium_polyedra.AAC.1